jgi:hypothetical protein
VTLEELTAAGARDAKPSELSESTLLAMAGKKPKVSEAPPTRPRRGDELTSPDPTPAPPITAPSPKPAFDPNGETARAQGEIRKGAPGEPIEAAEGRAKSTEQTNNPVAKDWLAQELISGTVAGPALGNVAEVVGPFAKRAAGAIAESSAGRAAGRALSAIAEGASQKLGVALGKVAPEAKEILKAKPWLANGKTSAEVADNFAREGKSLAEQREKLFEHVDSRSADTGGVPEPVDGAETKVLTKPNFQPGSKLEGETKYLPNPGPTATSENATVGLKAGEAPIGQGEDPAVAGGASKPGAPMALITKAIDKRVAKLATGTQSEREIAKAMEAHKADLIASHGEGGSIPTSDLRRQISDYQDAFDKTASNVANKSRKEMAGSLKDAMKEHVGDPKLQGEIDRLTDQMSVMTRAEKALRDKAGKEANPAGRAPSGHGMLEGIAHDLSHAHSGYNAAVKVGKRVSSPVMNAADRALAGGARAASGVIDRLVKQGIAERWSSARLASEIAKSRDEAP